MLFRQKLRNFSQGSTPPSPVAHFFGMLLSGALGLSILALWISAASVYVDPRIFKWAALLGLLFPLFLLGTFILWIIGLLFVPRKTWLLGLLGLLFCSGSIRNYVAIHPFSETQETTAQPNKIKVLSYNTLYFGRMLEQQDELVRYLINQQADIICFQEGELFPDKVKKFRKQFARTSTPYYSCNDNTGECVGIISAYPIMKEKLISSFPGNAVMAYHLQHPRGEFIVVNCHFRSNQLTTSNLNGYSNLIHGKSSSEQASDPNIARTLASKIANAAIERAKMVDDVEEYLAQYKELPVILCGDFNDTPISYTRQRVARMGLTDAFREAGHGFGFSFRRSAIRVRIDHIFCSPTFQPVQAKIDETATYSDHQPISATLLWRNDSK